MADDESRIPCRVCGRKFAPDSLPRHQNVCKAVASKPRKVFDSSKQRAIQGELSVKDIKKAQKKDVAPPKNHWREKHADFLSAVRSSRGVTRALETGGPLPPPPPPSKNPDYIQCPYCPRRFNEKAAQRHIDFCKEQSLRLPRGKPDPAAKAKQSTRLNYQPPKLKPKTASQPSSPMGASGRGAGISARGGMGARGTAAAPTRRYPQDDVSNNANRLDVVHEDSDSAYNTQTNSYSRLYSTHHKENQRQLYYSKQEQNRQNQKSKNPSHPLRGTPRPENHSPHDETAHGSYLESYRDGNSDKLANFPDHFNKRYKNKSVGSDHMSSKSKNQSPSQFQYLDSIQMDDVHDDGNCFYSNESHVALYGKSKTAKPFPASQRKRGGGESQPATREKNILSHCQSCSTKYPTAEAKFCCECGQKRLMEGKTTASHVTAGTRYSRLK